MAEPVGHGSAIIKHVQNETENQNFIKPFHPEFKIDSLPYSKQEFDISKTQGVTLKAPIKVFDSEILAVIDTGAEVTVMSDHVFKNIPSYQRQYLIKASRSLMVADHSQAMNIMGILKTKITIGSTELQWPVYIAPIKDDILLGCDLFDAYDMTLSIKNGLKINGEWVECEIFRSPDTIARVSIKETMIIPANSEIIAMGTVENFTEQYGIIEPLEQQSIEDESQVIVARAIVKPSTVGIPVRLLNPLPNPVELIKNSTIAQLNSIESLVELGEPEEKHHWSYQCHSLCEAHLTGHENCDPHGLRDNEAPSYIRNIQLDKVQAPVIPSDFQPVQESTDSPMRINEKLDEEFSVPQHLEELFHNSCKNIKDKHDKEVLARIFQDHENAFAKNKTDLGNCSIIQHKIDTGQAAPIRQPMRRTPKGFELEEEQYLQDQLEAGVVVPSNSAWSSPICLVRKKDGTVRWCVDYRKLNQVTVKDAYPIPRIDLCLDCLASAKIFSTLDLQSGYWQLKVAEQDREKTAFITKYGLFEYTKLPFGLCGAPGTFERGMEMVLRGLQWKTLLIYLDDIIIFSSNLQEHFKRLEEVLSRLSKANLKLKPSKCHLLQKEVLFLGHIVGQNGIRPNPELIKSVREWNTPKSTKQVQQFLGLANYYRRFIKNFSEIASPLSQLTKKDVKFSWSKECQKSMETLKKALCAAPILAYPVPDGRYILDCDASNSGIGAVLSQVQEGQERVISYGSKKLDKAQRNYCVTRRELLSLVTFIIQYRHYLLGKQFTLRTDHSSLRWLFNFKEPEGQLARWLEVLAQYNFEIVHRDGKKHGNCDALSRQYCDEESCDHFKQGTDLAQLPCGGCSSCTKKQNQWEHFENEANDVIPLGISPAKPAMLNQEVFNRRVQTRNMDHQDPEKATPSQQKTINWFRNYSPEVLARFQKEDKDLGMLHIWISENSKPNRDEAASLKPALRKYWLNWENIVKQDGVLYQQWHFPDKEKAPCLQLLVPRVLQREVLTHCHNSLFAAHLGISKTISAIKQRFYWYRLGADVELHVKQCPTCSANRHPAKRLKAALKDYRVGAPMDRIGIDIMGPLPISNHGNSYVMVVGDYFTRWIEAYAIPDQQAETTAKTLVNEFISRLGIPLEIHTDQGRNFESQLFQEVCSMLEVKKTRSTPSHPQSNGLIERFNRTLGKMMRSFIDSNKQDWDIHIPLLTAAYRSSIHPATGFTPNKLMLGREVNLPVDILFPRPSHQETFETHEYVSNMRDKMQQCYDIARDCLERAAIRQKRDHDTRVLENQYEVGQLVYKRFHIRKKLEHPWEGPYVIIGLLGNSIYRVTNKRKALILHHDLLKPYTSEFIPRWASKLSKQVTSKSKSFLNSKQ